MSTVIRGDGRAAVEYTFVDDAAEPACDRPVLVSLDRWTREREALVAHGQAVGVRIPNTLDVIRTATLLLPASLLLLEFPSFGDGRAYSQARLLRETQHYAGEIRATGAAVVRDQLLGMIRCGIDSFELRADQRVDDCWQALRELSLAYQPAADVLPRVRELRRRGA